MPISTSSYFDPSAAESAFRCDLIVVVADQLMMLKEDCTPTLFPASLGPHYLHVDSSLAVEQFEHE